MIDKTSDLRARIEELEERLRQAEALLRPIVTWPASWRLSPQQARLLGALYKAPGILTYERLGHAVSALTAWDSPDPSLVGVLLCNLRKKVPHGVVIETRRSIGLELVAGRDILRRALDHHECA
jgi:hypothetical protein